MNTGVIVYCVAEALVFLYVAFIFYKMGRNKEEKYVKMRQMLTKALPFFKHDKLYYAASLAMLVVIAIRLAERFTRGF